MWIHCNQRLRGFTPLFVFLVVHASNVTTMCFSQSMDKALLKFPFGNQLLCNRILPHLSEMEGKHSELCMYQTFAYLHIIHQCLANIAPVILHLTLTFAVKMRSRSQVLSIFVIVSSGSLAIWQLFKSFQCIIISCSYQVSNKVLRILIAHHPWLSAVQLCSARQLHCQCIQFLPRLRMCPSFKSFPSTIWIVPWWVLFLIRWLLRLNLFYLSSLAIISWLMSFIISILFPCTWCWWVLWLFCRCWLGSGAWSTRRWVSGAIAISHGRMREQRNWWAMAFIHVWSLLLLISSFSNWFTS